MKFILCLILVTFILIITESNIINPTVTNSSGVWYIASKTDPEGNEPSIVSNYIDCMNTYCHIICDQINGCVDTIINASLSINVEIQCTKDYSCNNIQLISAALNSTTLYCSGHKACSFSKLYFTETMNFIFIICSSNVNNFACFENSYYLPFNNNNNTNTNNKETQININCFAFGCYYFGNIYIENNKINKFLNTKFSINGCNQCNILSECIYNYSIYCINMNKNQTKNDLFIDGYCKSQWCQCDELYHVVYNDDTNINCPNYYLTNESNESNKSNKSNIRFIIVLLIGVIVLSIFVGFSVLSYCVIFEPTQPSNCKKQDNETKNQKANQPDDDTNDDINNKNTLGYNKVSTYSELDDIDGSIVHHDHTQNESDEEDVTSSERSMSDRQSQCISNNINGTILIPTKIFCMNHDQGLHHKSKRKLLTTYSMDEVAVHCTMNSCWIIVDNLVLDVTKFLKYHPGTVISIIKYGGTVCDEYFAFHSTAAKQLFLKFVIGKIHQTNSTNCFIQ